MPVDELVVEDVIAENDAMVVHRGRWRGQPIWIQVVRGDHAEARIAIRPRVAHAVLPPVLAEGRLADGRPYLVLPALEGEDLAVRLRRGPLSVPDGLALVDSVGGALAALHDAGLLHRDLRPESIFFRSMAGVQLLDAGLVHAAAGSGRLRGAHDHLAPERLFGEPATVASEVYELAALLWIALAQKLPWPSATGPAGRRGVPPLPVPEAGAALDAVVRRALSTVPERRPPSVSAFLDELRAATLAPAGPVEERRTHDVRPLPAEPDVSSVVGDTYRLLRILGRGGCGAVYEAEHLRLPRRFAIKMLRPGDGESAQLRFRREAEIIAALDHPHIVQVYDYDVDEGGSPFMVMELLEGETLRQRLQRGPLDLDEVLAMLGQVADAVEAAHARGVIHRDLKPENLFLVRGDELDVQVLDFGISKVLTAGEHTLAGTMLGTPGYAAPEQVRGDMTAIGPTTDVFALGAIVYEALAGKPAFDTSSIEAALYQICHEQPTPLRRLAKVTRAVEAVVERALAKRPQERFAGPAELAAALALAMRRRPARARWWTAGAGLAVVGSLAVVGLVANRPADHPPPAAPSPVAPALAAETAPVPAAVPPSPPTDASVRLAVTPAHAHVTLDEVDIQGGELRLSPGEHHLVVSAPGYAKVDRSISAAAVGPELRIRLVRTAGGRPRPRPTPTPSLRDLLEKK